MFCYVHSSQFCVVARDVVCKILFRSTLWSRSGSWKSRISFCRLCNITPGAYDVTTCTLIARVEIPFPVENLLWEGATDGDDNGNWLSTAWWRLLRLSNVQFNHMIFGCLSQMLTLKLKILEGARVLCSSLPTSFLWTSATWDCTKPLTFFISNL